MSYSVSPLLCTSGLWWS